MPSKFPSFLYEPVLRSVSRLRWHAAASLEGRHSLLLCQDYRVWELRKGYSYLFAPPLRTSQQPRYFRCIKSANNLIILSFLNKHQTFSLYFWAYGFFIVACQDPSATEISRKTTWLKGKPFLSLHSYTEIIATFTKKWVSKGTLSKKDERWANCSSAEAFVWWVPSRTPLV